MALLGFLILVYGAALAIFLCVCFLAPAEAGPREGLQPRARPPGPRFAFEHAAVIVATVASEAALDDWFA